MQDARWPSRSSPSEVPKRACDAGSGRRWEILDELALSGPMPIPDLCSDLLLRLVLKLEPRDALKPSKSMAGNAWHKMLLTNGAANGDHLRARKKQGV